MAKFHVYDSLGSLVDTIDVNVETESEAMALYGIVHDMSLAFMLKHGWKVKFAETRPTELITMGTPPRTARGRPTEIEDRCSRGGVK